MWLTNYRYLNDENEILYGSNILEEYLEKIYHDRNRSLDERTHYRKLFKELINIGYQPFITSFCDKNDCSYAWKIYADDYHGVSIAFKKSLFKKKPLDIEYNLYKVIYCKDAVENLLKCFIDEFTNHTAADFPSDLKILISNIIPHLAKFKGKDFSEESEWRAVYHNIILDHGNFTSPFPYSKLITTLNPGVFLHPNAHRKLPVQRLNGIDFYYGDIEYIRVGKRCDFALAATLIKKVLNEAGLNPEMVEVRHWDMPNKKN